MRLLLLSGFILVVACARAQSGSAGASGGAGAAVKPVPEPVFLNQVYYYWSDSLMACPKTDGQMSNKA